MLHDGPLTVAFGTKTPGTATPMAAGLDGGAVKWKRVLPTVDPTTVKEDAPPAAALAHGLAFAVYELAGSREGSRLIALDAATGDTRWDVAVPRSEAGSGFAQVVAGARRVYLAHWVSLDAFDAQTGKLVGTIP